MDLFLGTCRLLVVLDSDEEKGADGQWEWIPFRRCFSPCCYEFPCMNSQIGSAQRVPGAYDRVAQRKRRPVFGRVTQED
jgi:hypothetical protein